MSVGLEEEAALVLVDCHNDYGADPLLDGAYGYYELYDADTSFDLDFQSLVERWGKVVLESVWAVVVQAFLWPVFFLQHRAGQLGAGGHARPTTAFLSDWPVVGTLVGYPSTEFAGGRRLERII